MVSVRVVDVIPGKNVIGLEIPNAKREIVYLSEILRSEKYDQSKSPLALALGKDIGGKPVVVDLAKMPHLLVAGTTGSGKSVAVNAMVLQPAVQGQRDDVRLIMIDPKMLELSVYEGIPHLLAPVVTDMKEAANALRWCVAEMERRYKLMAAVGVRNLAGFNKKVAEADEAGPAVAGSAVPAAIRSMPNLSAEPLEPLPYIVVIIDEFADMMMIVGKKVEELIARLAQKARAAGIHLILATQRPSVDVITGLIKANIPTRIAFQVSSKIDSRTILDQSGAETLLGHGDMLYLPPGTATPERVHGAFVDDDEVHSVVAWLKSQGEPELHRGRAGGSAGDRRRQGHQRVRPAAGRRGRRRRRRRALRQGRGHRHANAPRVDLRRAAAPAHRLQPCRAPDRADGSRRRRQRAAAQRQPRSAGAATTQGLKQGQLARSLLVKARQATLVSMTLDSGNAMKHLLIYALAVLMMSLGTSALAATGPGRARLNTFAHDLHSLTGHFSETLTNVNGQGGKASSGTLALEAPREFRWDTTSPYKQIIVADGSRVWLYDPELEQVTVRKQSTEEAHSPLTVLTDVKQLEHNFKVTEQGEHDGLVWLRLTSTGDQPQFEYADLGFDASGLARMRFRDQLGSITDIRFSDWRRNVAIPPSTFNFVPPKGADVIGDVPVLTTTPLNR